jgi:hypothetical protein
MGDARRRKKQDPNFGKVRQKLVRGSFTNPFSSLREFVEYHTEQKGRGYLVCADNECFYYGEEDYVGDEDELLLKNIHNYNPHEEVVLVRQAIPQEPLFSTSVVSLLELEKA